MQRAGRGASPGLPVSPALQAEGAWEAAPGCRSRPGLLMPSAGYTIAGGTVGGDLGKHLTLSLLWKAGRPQGHEGADRAGVCVHRVALGLHSLPC